MAWLIRPDNTTGSFEENPIAKNCYIDLMGVQLEGLSATPGNRGTRVPMWEMPTITDNKSANYPLIDLPGRAAPLTTYSSSGSRNISWTANYTLTRSQDVSIVSRYIFALNAATYPRESQSFQPPPLCRLRCYNLLANEKEPVFTVLASFSTTYDTGSLWIQDNNKILPQKVELSLEFVQVWGFDDLPSFNRVYGWRA